MTRYMIWMAMDELNFKTALERRLIMLFFLIILNTSLPTQETFGWHHKSYPSELESSLMLNKLFKNDVLEMFDIHSELYGLPKAPWPKHVQEVLLYIMNKYYIERKYYTWSNQVKELSPDGEHIAEMLEMCVWQKDARFAPLIAQELGSGWLAIDGMTALGEPAFGYILTQLNRQGQGVQWGAAMTLGQTSQTRCLNKINLF